MKMSIKSLQSIAVESSITWCRETESCLDTFVNMNSNSFDRYMWPSMLFMEEELLACQDSITDLSSQPDFN